MFVDCRMDEFIIQCPKLGRLERLRVGHDNSGFGPGWYLDKVRFDDYCSTLGGRWIMGAIDIFFMLKMKPCIQPSFFCLNKSIANAILSISFFKTCSVSAISD